MSIKSAVVAWTRYHPEVDALGRVVFSGTWDTARPTRSSVADEVQGSAALAVAERPAPLGTTGGLARILTAMMRQAHAGPSDRERTRAPADLLLETIRVLSVL
jgi:hypothetical protein